MLQKGLKPEFKVNYGFLWSYSKYIFMILFENLLHFQWYSISKNRKICVQTFLDAYSQTKKELYLEGI